MAPACAFSFVWKCLTPLDGSKISKTSIYEVLVDDELHHHKNTIADSYLQRYIWDFLWYPFTHAQTHTTHSECELTSFNNFSKLFGPLNFPTLALTWNSSKHMRQVSFAISMATGKMGSYTVILPIRRFGRLSFSLWIPEWNAQIKINAHKGKCSQNWNENLF